MKKRILVVEDEIIIADDLCNTLKKLGYEALEPALNYKEAIEAFDSQEVDIVILDVNLGVKKTGIDVAHYIKRQSDTPFIYLTSYTDSRTLELAKATMPYAYLVKPFEEADVMASIEIALNNHSRFVQSREKKSEDVPDFTLMEKVVLRKIADNLTTKQIADELSVSESTVKNHRHNICQKLSLPASTNSLLSWAISNKKYLNS